jgi:hypothetical protein
VHITALTEAMWTVGATAMASASDGETEGEIRARLEAVVSDVVQQGAAEWTVVVTRSLWSCAGRRATAILEGVDGAHPAVHALVAAALRDPSDPPTELHKAVRIHTQTCQECSAVVRVVCMMDGTGRRWRPATSVSSYTSTDAGFGRTIARRGRPTPPTRRGTPPASGAVDTGPTRGAGRAIWPVVALWVALGWWKWGPSPEIVAAVGNRYVVLVDRTPPEVPSASTLPKAAADIRRDLLTGDCFTAAARGRGIWQKHPQSDALGLLVGAALICAGNGRAAVEVLSSLGGRTPGGRVSFLLAQAHLLEGQPGTAIELLEGISEDETQVHARAENLRDQISQARSGR